MVLPDSIFIQLAIVLGLAASAGYFIRLLKLPLIIAYLLTGVALSALQIFNTHTSLALTFLPEIGVAFVLFFVGMELDLEEIKDLGKAVVITTLGQVVLSLSAGFLIATAFSFPQKESLLLGLGLSFSSTIVVIKLLLEKKDLSSLYGKLSIGILLLEDLIAIMLLMAMTVGSSFFNFGLQDSLPLTTLLIKGAILFLAALFLSRYILSQVFRAAARSSELLFLSALAWCFIFVSISILLGFSVVIGAFLAGFALANSPFHFEIQGKVKPLRDFFVTIFFAYLGSQVIFNELPQVLPLILIFTLYALIIKPIIILLLLGCFGFRKHTLFQTSLNLSQVSEFSLIILMVGMKLGLASAEALTAMALTGVLSIIISSVAIAYSKQIYSFASPFIGLFEHGGLTHQREKKKSLEMEGHVILIGAHRIGGEIVRFLKRESIPFLVLDFNPALVQKLEKEKIHALYGDLGDPEILEFLNLEKAKLVISTAADIDDNLMLLAEIKRRKARVVVVARAASVDEAQELYESGADYVILPEIVSGDFVAHVLRSHWPNMEFFKTRPEVELNKLSKNYLAFE